MVKKRVELQQVGWDPALRALLDDADSTSLHNNICSCVIDYQHQNKGWWRARVVSYDPLTNLHALDSTGLDIANDNWFYVDGVPLNWLLLTGKLKLVPPSLAQGGERQMSIRWVRINGRDGLRVLRVLQALLRTTPTQNLVIG